MKNCRRCQEDKAFGEFSKSSRNKDGLQSWCKTCSLQDYRKRYERNPDDFQRTARRSNWKNKYGLTEEQYNSLLAKQGGLCAICRRECRSYKRLSVDHCHETGIIRGLLCRHCNAGLGKFEDNLEYLSSAIRYLENNT